MVLRLWNLQVANKLHGSLQIVRLVPQNTGDVEETIFALEDFFLGVNDRNCTVSEKDWLGTNY